MVGEKSGAGFSDVDVVACLRYTQSMLNWHSIGSQLPRGRLLGFSGSNGLVGYVRRKQLDATR